jgi:hypothetical protein
MIDIAKEMQGQYSREEHNRLNKQMGLIVSSDLKYVYKLFESFEKIFFFLKSKFSLFREVVSFQYKFTVPLRDLCKNSKRCLHVLKPLEDAEYINLLKLPKFTLPHELDKSLNRTAAHLLNASQHLYDTTNHLRVMNNHNDQSILSPSTSILASSSILKRKASTPHPAAKSPNSRSKALHINQYLQQETTTETQVITGGTALDDYKARTLTSSLRCIAAKPVLTNSGSKSVKFKLTKCTRKIEDEGQVVDDEVRDFGAEDSYPSPNFLADSVVRKSLDKVTVAAANDVNGEEKPCTSSDASPSAGCSSRVLRSSPERKKLTFVENDENEEQSMPTTSKNANLKEVEAIKKEAKVEEETCDDDGDDNDESMEFDL